MLPLPGLTTLPDKTNTQYGGQPDVENSTAVAPFEPHLSPICLPARSQSLFDVILLHERPDFTSSYPLQELQVFDSAACPLQGIPPFFSSCCMTLDLS